MKYFICHDCQDEVPSGEAVVRSVSFRQVSYCRPCWHELHASPVPAQRVSVEDVRSTTHHGV